MKFINYIIGLCVCLFVSLSIRAQVTVDIAIDSLELFVGKQAHITLGVSYPAGKKLQMPLFAEGDTLVSGVEVVTSLPADTQRIHDGARLFVSQTYAITSFDTAFYYLPPMKVWVDDSTFESKSLALRVLPVPIDTLNVSNFFGPKDIVNPPFAWEDWSRICWMSILLLLLTALWCYLYVRNRDNKPVIRIVKRVPKIPPHKLAMEEIERIKSERKWASEDSKEYYTLLTDTLRTYIQNRYGFNAKEMISSEIIERLMQNSDQTALEELKELFATADLVKFAKYSTLANENDRNLLSAIDFINQTKIEPDPNAKPEQEEMIIEEKNSRTYVIALRAGVVLTLLLGVVLAGYIAYDVYKLLM